MRLDHYLAESRRCGFDAGHRVEEIKIWMGAPGMAVGSSRLGLFSPGGQAKVQHLSPGAKQAEILVAQSNFLDGPEKVEPEVVRALCERGIRQDLLHHALLAGGEDGVGQHAQDVGMLAEAFALGRVGQQAAGRVPAFRVDRMSELCCQGAVLNIFE